MPPARDSKGRFIPGSGGGGGGGKAGKGPIQIDLGSFRMTIIAIGRAAVSMETAARASIGTAGAVLHAAVLRNVSRTDYTLEQLAKMGHPYARRHGKIQSAKLGGEFTQRPYLVHKRSGAFKSSIRGRFAPSPSIGYDVYAQETVPWVRKVIMGSRYMLPRDVVWETAHERAVISEMRRAVIAVLGKGLRTQAAVRFG